jgi:hypothetical protein
MIAVITIPSRNLVVTGATSLTQPALIGADYISDDLISDALDRHR